jgi:hypothetical protein
MCRYSWIRPQYLRTNILGVKMNNICILGKAINYDKDGRFTSLWSKPLDDIYWDLYPFFSLRWWLAWSNLRVGALSTLPQQVLYSSTCNSMVVFVF